MIYRMRYLLPVLCAAGLNAAADNPPGAPSQPAPAPAPKVLPNLSKSIFSPATTSLSAKRADGPSPETGKADISQQLTPPEDLPGASTEQKVSDENPMQMLDPDGVPILVSQRQPEKPSEALLDAYLKERAIAEQNRDWLLRYYEQQEQARQAKDKDTTPNLYTELTSNRELAKLAGLPYTGEDTSFRTGDSTGGDANGPELRKDSGENAAAKNPKPAVPGWAYPAAVKITAPMPLDIGQPLATDLLPAPTPGVKVDDASDLDTPGMVSAKDDGDSLSDPASANLNLDMLPGESVQHAMAHQDANSPAELSLPMDLTQMHKQEAEANEGAQLPRVPSISPVAAVTPPGPPAPVPGKDEKPYDPNAPVPVSQVPVPSTRPPLANPFDILNR